MKKWLRRHETIVVIAVFGLVFITAMGGLAYIVAGKEAQTYFELTGVRVTRSDMIWAGNRLAIRPEDIRNR